MKNFVIFILIFLTSCSSGGGFGSVFLNKKNLVKDPDVPYVLRLKSDVIESNQLKSDLESSVKPIEKTNEKKVLVFSPSQNSVISLPLKSDKKEYLQEDKKAERDERIFVEDKNVNALDKPISSRHFAYLWMFCMTPICILLFSLLVRKNKI